MTMFGFYTQTHVQTHWPTHMCQHLYIHANTHHLNMHKRSYVGYGNDKKIVNKFVLKYPSGKRN